MGGDHEIGFNQKPDRYARPDGRETIDAQRDLARERAAGFLSVHDPYCASPFTSQQLGDMMFAYLCDAQAMRYTDRAGRKGGEEGARRDRGKADFYTQMGEHVRGRDVDPRAGRPDFKPYEERS